MHDLKDLLKKYYTYKKDIIWSKLILTEKSCGIFINSFLILCWWWDCKSENHYELLAVSFPFSLYFIEFSKCMSVVQSWLLSFWCCIQSFNSSSNGCLLEIKLSASVWKIISWNLTKFQLIQLIQTIFISIFLSFF